MKSDFCSHLFGCFIHLVKDYANIWMGTVSTAKNRTYCKWGMLQVARETKLLICTSCKSLFPVRLWSTAASEQVPLTTNGCYLGAVLCKCTFKMENGFLHVLRVLCSGIHMHCSVVCLI